MSRRGQRRHPIYRVNLKLDTERDADLVAWLESLPDGNRSQAIREMLRAGLGLGSANASEIDLEALRRVVADELSRALAGQRLAPLAADPPAEESQVDMEAKFGSKLDRLLGSISQGGHNKPDEV